MFRRITAAKDALLQQLSEMHLTLPDGERLVVDLEVPRWQELPGVGGAEVFAVPRNPQAMRQGPLLNVVYLPAGLQVSGLSTDDGFLLACMEGSYYLNGLQIREGQSVHLPAHVPQDFHTPNGPAYGVALLNPPDTQPYIP